ncbi:GTP-binding protein, partial [Malassezia vespertilionis]
QVSEQEGKELAQQLKCGWVETSARHNANVPKVFEMTLAEIEKAQGSDGSDAPASRCSIM